MKLYVLPVGLTCNAHCKFCITKFREMPQHTLKIKDLETVLAKNKFEKIEITGVGEPGLHPKINEIVEKCCLHAPTQIYTNGTYKPDSSPGNLISVCLSRAHHKNALNKKIMGVPSDPEQYHKLRIPLKLSVLVHKSGVASEAQLLDYLEWAKDYADKVVVRQLFEYEDKGYPALYKREFVPTAKLLNGSKSKILENGNRQISYKGLKVEIEERSCACENTNPVLGADGILREGWEV